jgi:hypothetical protein
LAVVPQKAAVRLHHSELAVRAISGSDRLFDHLVGDGEHNWRNAKAERLGGLEIIAEHPPKIIAVPADLRKHEQTATISRKHFSGSGRIM